MITPKTMTALFLLNRTWALQQIKSGVAAKLVSRALQGLNKDELEVVREHEEHGSLIHLKE